jgi:ERCC4-type nuclease
MEVTGISTTKRNTWEELRQETMRNSQKNTATSTGQDAAVINPSNGGQELPVVSITSEDSAGDGVAMLMERINAQKKRPAPATASPSRAASGPVTTNLENVGPNMYERIRANAGSAYLVRKAGYADDTEAVSALRKSA